MLNLTRWPGLLVFALAGLAAVGLAFVSVNLFAEAMANIDFIQRHGRTALQTGALVQMAELILWGSLALVQYLIFKLCEVELVFRYFRWAGRVGSGSAGRSAVRLRRNREEAS